MSMKIAVIVQRYGLEINGGAELHARWIAEHLSQTNQVTVLTTCAQDYLYWFNHYPVGPSLVNNIEVIRFKVKHPRRGRRFVSVQNRVFFDEHDQRDEWAWVKENGPYAPALINYLKKHQRDYDLLIFFSYRYYTTFYGLQVAPMKSLLVPTAEEDPVISLAIYRQFFNKPAAIIYNSIEEQAMIHELTGNGSVPGEVVGVGINVLEGIPARFSQKYSIKRPYVLYVGRIDKNKGCDRLIDYMLRYFEREQDDFDLVLIGGQYMNVPEHEHIITPGFVSEQDKFDAISGSMFMVIPSHFESLCMALLECWALEKAALVNARCRVLEGQVTRANGGLFYNDYSEFQETMTRLLRQVELRNALGKQGRDYFNQHYTWPVVMAKYDHLMRIVQNQVI
ncbi:glycosyltransferase family 4 protein [bacterium]|nr:glycosyltransferase family 4 protein [bacterium]